MRPIYVYWLHDETCVDPQNDGYVGITINFKRRMACHRRSNKFPAHFTISILYEGSRDECREIEFGMRPKWNMGWNRAPGGAICSSAAWNKGIPMSEKSKSKLKASKKGIKLGPCSEETKRKIGIANTGRIRHQTPEERTRRAVTLRKTLAEKRQRGLASYSEQG